MNRSFSWERGFTLVEMLFVISIIGVLSGLSIVGFKVYKGNAAYSVAESTLGYARTALEGGILATEEGPGSVAAYSQNTGGEISDATARELLPTLILPDNLKFQVQYTAGCSGDATCLEAVMQVDPCQSDEFVRWMRWGDGVTIQLDNVYGSNCT